MKNKIRKRMPPGFPGKTERDFFLLGSVVSFLISLSGWQSYWNCYKSLWEYNSMGVKMLSEKKMPPFSVVFQTSFVGFEVFAILALIWIILHYCYFFQGSRSIYLMRRLPNRGELFWECLFLPIIMAAVYLICAVILVLLYAGIYYLITPEQCIIPECFNGLWEVLL